MYNRRKLLKDDRLVVTVKQSKIEVKPWAIEGDSYVIHNSYNFVECRLKGEQVIIINEGVVIAKLVEKNGNVVRLYLDKHFKRKCNGGNENE